MDPNDSNGKHTGMDDEAGRYITAPQESASRLDHYSILEGSQSTVNFFLTAGNAENLWITLTLCWDCARMPRKMLENRT